jgi:hypothetical protein
MRAHTRKHTCYILTCVQKHMHARTRTQYAYTHRYTRVWHTARWVSGLPAGNVISLLPHAQVMVLPVPKRPGLLRELIPALSSVLAPTELMMGGHPLTFADQVRPASAKAAAATASVASAPSQTRITTPRKKSALRHRQEAPACA